MHAICLISLIIITQVFNATEEISTAANYPFIRLFTAALVSSLIPLDELARVEQKWSPAGPGSKTSHAL